MRHTFAPRLGLALLVLASAALATGCVYSSPGRSSYGSAYGRYGSYGGGGGYYEPYSSGRYYDYQRRYPPYYYCRDCRDRDHLHDEAPYENRNRSHPLGREQAEEWKDMRGEQKQEWRDLQRAQEAERRRLREADQWDAEDKRRQREQRRAVDRVQSGERREVREEHRDERDDYQWRRRH